ncbi:MAG: hypothetical protein J6B04_05540 [Clostridia bacterium]|nr:hypothetical protein [Clostridia bacterium]
MDTLLCFVSVEFINDPNVVGIKYWYVCKDSSVKVGDKVIAPLGRHNNTQEGVVREVRFDKEYNSPFPIYLIKYVTKVVR